MIKSKDSEICEDSCSDYTQGSNFLRYIKLIRLKISAKTIDLLRSNAS